MSKTPLADAIAGGKCRKELQATAWCRARYDGYRESEKEYEGLQEFPYAR
jgi:hypothetical protein